MFITEADRLVERAVAALVAGDNTQARTLLDGALRADPTHLMATCKCAELAVATKDFERALVLTRQVLDKEPNFAPAWACRGRALWLSHRTDDAYGAASRALDIQPPNSEYRLLLAQFAAWTGRVDEAAEILAPLLNADHPAYGPALAMSGEAAMAASRFEHAETALTHALEASPNQHAARMLRGMNRLRLGDFEAGWVDYAAREQIDAFRPVRLRYLPGTTWTGQDLAGRTLLVADDQGNGDAIQLFRYLPLILECRPAHVFWLTFPALARLFAANAPANTVSIITSLADARAVDLHCTSTTLPRWFATSATNIPAPTRYLCAAGSSTPRRTRGIPKVGIAWSGYARHPRDHLRSIPASGFLKLMHESKVEFHSLQHQVRTEDRLALQAHQAMRRDVEAASDFADTASLIDGLDLVISVDSAVAHLAGALGKPVWIVLHSTADWRWMIEREDSPWYPSARLFRTAPGEWQIGSSEMWSPVLNRIGAALRDVLRRKPQRIV